MKLLAQMPLIRPYLVGKGRVRKLGFMLRVQRQRLLQAVIFFQFSGIALKLFKGLFLKLGLNFVELIFRRRPVFLLWLCLKIGV